MVANGGPTDPSWFTTLGELRDVRGVCAEQALEQLARARPTALRYIGFVFGYVNSYYDERDPMQEAFFGGYVGIKFENGNTTLREMFLALQMHFEDDDDEGAMVVWPEDFRAVMLMWFATTPRRREHFLKLVAVHLRTAGLTAMPYE